MLPIVVFLSNADFDRNVSALSDIKLDAFG